jgi:hypothetical protein
LDVNGTRYRLFRYRIGIILNALQRNHARRNEIIRIAFAMTCIGLPLIIPSIRYLSFGSLAKWYDRARYIWSRRWQILRPRKPPLDDCYGTYLTVLTPQQESDYWESALSSQKHLAFSHAHRASMGSLPVIMSYKPALLPRYRTKRSDVDRIDMSPEYYLSARTFCKWHRMIFPGPVRSDVCLGAA